MERTRDLSLHLELKCPTLRFARSRFRSYRRDRPPSREKPRARRFCCHVVSSFRFRQFHTGAHASTSAVPLYFKTRRKPLRVLELCDAHDVYFSISGTRETDGARCLHHLVILNERCARPPLEMPRPRVNFRNGLFYSRALRPPRLAPCVTSLRR